MTTNSDSYFTNLPQSDPQKPITDEGSASETEGEDCARFTASVQEIRQMKRFLCRSGYNICRILAIVVPCFTALHVWDGNTFLLPFMILVEIIFVIRWISVRIWLRRRDGVGNEYTYTLTDQGLECDNKAADGIGWFHFRFNPDKIIHYKESANHLYFTYNQTVFFIRKSALRPDSKIPDYLRTNSERNTAAAKRGGWNVRKPEEVAETFGYVPAPPKGGIPGKIATPLMVLSIAALLVAYVVIGYAAPAGSDVTRRFWIFLLFLPFPIASIVVGILLNVKGVRNVRNIVVGAIVTVYILVFGMAFGWIQSGLESRGLLTELSAELDISYSEWTGVKKVVNDDYRSSYTYTFDPSAPPDFGDYAAYWTDTPDAQIRNILDTYSIELGSGEKVLVYNRDLNEVGTIPSDGEVYSFAILIYSEDETALTVSTVWFRSQAQS
ncbi:MAG: hypothetical protein ACI3YK_03725 [Eubacteriales bacterium]